VEPEAIHELTAAYALDALDEADERAYEDHLARCERCRSELAELSETATALAFATDAPAPPPALRERIVSQARAERPNVVPLRPKRRIAPYLAAAAAACAALGLGIWASSLERSLDRERDARARQARAVEIVGEPDAKRIPLSSGTGTLVVTRTGDAALVLPKLDRPPDGKTYEAWVIEGGKPLRAGTFDGGGPQGVPLERPVPDGALVAVTIERAGGVDVPSGQPVFRSESA
jgi:anti-sigma factor RsiW